MHAHRRVIEKILEFALAPLQRVFGVAPRPAAFGVAQFPFNRWNQPGQIVLGDIIPRAGLHDVHRRLFTDGTGDDDEGNVVPLFLQHFKRRETAESGHGIVAEDDIPALFLQGGRHGGG